MIDQHSMWHMLRVFGVGGKLLIAVQSFYVDSRVCVQVGMDVSEWFPVNVEFGQGCVMCPRLFNMYMVNGACKRDGTVECKWWHV